MLAGTWLQSFEKHDHVCRMLWPFPVPLRCYPKNTAFLQLPSPNENRSLFGACNFWVFQGGGRQLEVPQTFLRIFFSCIFVWGLAMSIKFLGFWIQWLLALHLWGMAMEETWMEKGKIWWETCQFQGCLVWNVNCVFFWRVHFGWSECCWQFSNHALLRFILFMEESTCCGQVACRTSVATELLEMGGSRGIEDGECLKLRATLNLQKVQKMNENGTPLALARSSALGKNKTVFETSDCKKLPF